MKKMIASLLLVSALYSYAQAQPKTTHNLIFDSLATRWDEAIPFGNGMLGALVWQKDGKLRISLDRADLWDERDALDLSKFNFKWVQQQVEKNTYDTVHRLGDDPYETMPYPTKIPAGAIEFNISKLGKVKKVSLDITTALCTVEFANGAVLNNYIHATNNVGYFGFENLSDADLIPELIVPNYNDANNNAAGNSVEGQGLQRLGYSKGTVTKTANNILYHQPKTKNNYYELLVQWQHLPGNRYIGQWTITNNKPALLPLLSTTAKEPTGWDTHAAWWGDYWKQSSVSIPDELLEKQYYLEMYKLGCVARKGSPAITLQAIWTADNGNLPPWKGDFHHDLNTELSYWPSYTGNHLNQSSVYTDWLWDIRAENRKFTKQYFGINGLNVPGVTTLSGKAMGGWIQYSLSPSTASWLAQHFYWQWKFSMDDVFLQQRAYPYLHDIATFVENITYLKNGKRMVALSSSPEYHDNNIKAWFRNYTNYDLSLYKFALSAAAEVATAVHKTTEAAHWKTLLQQLPDFDVNETGLTISPGQNLDESHRHHAQLMAIYPIAQLDANNNTQKKIIELSLHRLEEEGTLNWCGYSFSWAACLYARAKQADSAVKQLQIFANNFCSINSFHLNGDQKGGQYSSFTYRPFTLEGNFAFAQGVHELLLQSKDHYIEVFPAVPKNWKEVSFISLRAEGAFLISAKKENGVPTEVKVFAEKGGMLRMKLPFKNWLVKNIPTQKIKKTGN
ncbi:MAG: glycoside hydrolase family 95-like protein, partial [Panacibacter sp.]